MASVMLSVMIWLVLQLNTCVSLFSSTSHLLRPHELREYRQPVSFTHSTLNTWGDNRPVSVWTHDLLPPLNNTRHWPWGRPAGRGCRTGWKPCVRCRTASPDPAAPVSGAVYRRSPERAGAGDHGTMTRWNSRPETARENTSWLGLDDMAKISVDTI